MVDRQGQPVLRFEIDSDPADPEFRMQLEQVLDGTFKKLARQSRVNQETPAAGDEDDDEGV